MSAEMTQWIMDTMISMTLLMAFVLLIRKPVSHFFGAKVAYALWALPVARFFMPILTLETTAPVATAEQPLIAGGAIAELPAMAPTEQIASGALASIDWLMIALIIWVGGAGMLFLSKLASYIQFREDIVSDGQLVGKHGNIRILETAAVGGPLAFGLFKKYIAVPTNFFRNYSPAERELALEHEIAHHESGDLFANFAGLMVLSLHWFNPVAWFAWVAFRDDQETACDARILQQSGQAVRAIYGRTIAKSASGHQLGLASPLNQKNKIKGRLKMLGKGEKSGFRKKLGIFMVGASTVVALPATATVVYIDADDAAEAHTDGQDGGVNVKSPGTSVNVGANGVLVTEKTKGGYKYTVSNKRGTFEIESQRELKRSEIDRQIGKMVPSFRKLSAPQPPAAPMPPEPPEIAAEEETVNITMLNGSKDFANDEQYVRRIRHDGRTIILRTNKKLSDAELREQIKEAEQSRREADAHLREHKREMRAHQREMKEHKREMRIEMREVEREVEEARRETEREMRESQREVQRAVWEAEREAIEDKREALRHKRKVRNERRPTSHVWSIANQISEISFAPQAPRASQPPTLNFSISGQLNCKAIGKDLAFNSGHGVMIEQAWASVVDCSGFHPKSDRKKLLKMTLQVLEQERSKAVSCKTKSHKDSLKLRVYDREIKHVRKKLTTA